MVSPILGAVPPVPAPQSSVPGIIPTDRVAAFDQAMARQQTADPQSTSTNNPAGASQALTPQALSPNDRARIGLDLAPAGQAPQPTEGNMILNGLSSLREVFDAREARVSEILKQGTTDATSLMQMQVEVANFTMLVDISSKLTGKTTQVFDTLMKGQ
ncbi:EscI/YscI/HrpB family type III secretion system inner rod protein [Rhizobium oryzicola]|uniref:EscI/YscI/HrpB family type III secretion system inner rod protein n=1 Tax=Rhizobium oryzicola TaxID=1232668 RepID=A0ABT8SXN3_9HYPH|nr:EscI/YscI/HrpB family type III secretion system inner rod protein [Rhizobium oryzicola]MDO1583180.1 EscI/YscI/HrpB family type III secretion system inner rod protein [Rhizobium oryzicola]